MKTTTSLSVLLLVWMQISIHAQTIALKGGSNGSDGSLVLEEDEDVELPLPPDGIFNFTSIRIGVGARLEFKRNALNTPVYLLATDDVIIDGNISVSAPAGYHGASSRAARTGGPGGFDGGHGGFGAILPGPGFGPGGGLPLHQVENAESPGSGNFSLSVDDGSDPLTSGKSYGNRILMPLIGGSGGAGHLWERENNSNEGEGGGGGGALLIASNKLIRLTSGARIWAQGFSLHDSRFNGDGSGGAIRLVAPAIEGNGDISVTGSNGTGGNGRVRIDCIVRENLDIAIIPRDDTEVVSYGANLVVFPDVVPQLRILEAAGRLIPENSVEPVSVTLVPGASEQQTVRVRVQDFEDEVKIAVVLTPNSGEQRVFETTIDNRNQNPAEATVAVNVIPNVQTHIHVWTVTE